MPVPASPHAGRAPAGATSRARSLSRSGALRRLGLWLVLAIVVVVLSIASPTFRSTFNLQNVLEQNALIGIVALGRRS